MSESGRYYVRDGKTGRVFCVEPLSADNEKTTAKVFKNGGTDTTSEKNKSQPQGGSIYEEDSIITEENGFKHIEFAPPGMSPMDIINKMLANGE
jgi:hypothetical protein